MNDTPITSLFCCMLYWKVRVSQEVDIKNAIPVCMNCYSGTSTKRQLSVKIKIKLSMWPIFLNGFKKTVAWKFIENVLKNKNSVIWKPYWNISIARCAASARIPFFCVFSLIWSYRVVSAQTPNTEHQIWQSTCQTGCLVKIPVFVPSFKGKKTQV